MRRIFVFVVGIIVTAVMLPLAGIAAETQKEVSLDASEQVILRLLSQPTTDAVYDYYGEYRQYWRQEILSIQKVPQSQYYEVITRVETFYGAHNPPYGLDTMTFYIDPVGTAQLISYNHHDEPD